MEQNMNNTNKDLVTILQQKFNADFTVEELNDIICITHNIQSDGLLTEINERIVEIVVEFCDKPIITINYVNRV